VGSIRAILSQAASLEIIRDRLKSGEKSRTGLARWICGEFGFEDERGQPRVSSCLKVLRDFEQAGKFKLPRRILDIVQHWRVRRRRKPVPKPVEVPAEVSQVRDLELCLVDPQQDEPMRIWNELMWREHPQGKRRLVGRQLRYLVGSAQGWLGAVGFSASALSLEARDQWIGWDPEQRLAHEGRVVNLSRLLIRPGVECKNLASFVLGACAARVPKDFAQRYGYEPWLLESFVEPEQHAGTCFKAANWKCVGETKGRGRNDRNSQFPESKKDIYVYPLVEDFRQRMGVAPQSTALAVEQGLGSKEWAQQEFGEVKLGDQRLRDRLIRIMTDRGEHPDVSYLAAAAGDRYAAKGYYYFIDNKHAELTPEAMLATHRQRTLQRMMNYPLVLVVQDTSDLNFSTRPQTTGLGVIGSNQTGAKSLGLKLHSSLALTREGLPLGVLRSVAEVQELKEEAEKQKPWEALKRPIEEKKSFRWIQGLRDCVAAAEEMPQTRLLMLADREGDIFELFAEAEATRKRVGVLVRAAHNRRLEGEEQKLWETLQASRNETRMEVIIPRQRTKPAKREQAEQPGLPARPAQLSVRFEKISLAPGRHLESDSAVTLWGVYVGEPEPPPEAKPIEWMLLTTEEIASGEQAAELVGLYSRRWRIEEWHRILKSGCRIEARQHQTRERLERAMAMDVVLAWRIHLLTLLGREVPELPCEVLFDVWEVRVLEALRAEQEQARQKSKRARTKKSEGSAGKEKRPLLLGEAIVQVAKLGGYLARASDPPPGAECLWTGMVRLCVMADGYRLAITGSTRAIVFEPG
jgi:hypothetical protein